MKTTIDDLYNNKKLSEFNKKICYYCKQEIITKPTDKPEWLEMDIVTTEQNFEPFIKKYKNTFARVVNGEYMKRKPESVEAMVHFIAHLNQERCNKLLFRLLAERQSWWWD